MNELTKAKPAELTSDQLRQELERSRAKVSASADALRDDLRQGVADFKAGASELKRNLDWKIWVARNPWGVLAGAFAVGLILGSRRRS